MQAFKEGISRDGFVLPHQHMDNATHKTLQKVVSKIPSHEMRVLFGAKPLEDEIKEYDKIRTGVGIGCALTLSVYYGRRICTLTSELCDRICRNRAEKEALADMTQMANDIAEQCSSAYGVLYEVYVPEILRNDEFCPEQSLHCDHDPSKVSDEHPKFSLVLFLDSEGGVVFYKGGHRDVFVGDDLQLKISKDVVERKIRASAQPGQFVLFRQDVPRKGSATLETSLRISFEIVPCSMNPRQTRKQSADETYHVSLFWGSVNSSS